MSSDLILGIDIGGTNTPFVVVDAAGAVLLREVIPTCAEQPLSHLLERLFERLDSRRGALPVGGELRAVGVGAPNGNALTGWVESPPNASWGRVDLAGELARQGGLPVFLTNDANAAALGEWRFGAGRGVDDLLVITLGTGLGSGLIVGGELVHGASGHAGELGHVCVEPGGRPCNCGLQGCLESWVSAGGMLRTARELDLDLGRWLRKGEEPHPGVLHRAALAGDLRAARGFEVTGEMLARGLATAVHVLSPALIVLCGGITRAGEWILGPVERHLPGLLMEPFRPTVRVVLGGLDPDLAGALGAAEWARLGLARGTEPRRA